MHTTSHANNCDISKPKTVEDDEQSDIVRTDPAFNARADSLGRSAAFDQHEFGEDALESRHAEAGTYSSDDDEEFFYDAETNDDSLEESTGVSSAKTAGDGGSAAASNMSGNTTTTIDKLYR